LQGPAGIATRLRGRTHSTPRWRGVSAAYSRLDLSSKIVVLEEPESTEGAVQLQPQSADGRMAGAFQFSGVRGAWARCRRGGRRWLRH